MVDESSQLTDGFQAHLISVYDKTYHRSVYNLLPASIKNTIEVIPETYKKMDERTARNKFRPTPVMNQLRAAFWLEYNRVQEKMSANLVMANVYAGICTNDYFNLVVTHSKEMIAWMLIPPQLYQALLNEAWDAGVARLREILDAPLFDSKGKISIQNANLIVRVWQLLDQRKHGSVVQKHMNLNISGADAKNMAGEMEKNSMEALDFRLKEVRKKMELAAKEEKEALELEVKVVASE